MEEKVAWIFNVDFEIRLFSNHFTNIQSNKLTQEFEFFIFLLAPGEAVLSSKKYNHEYLEWVENFTGIKPRLASKSTYIKNWCAEYSDVQLLQKLQLKENTLKFLTQKKLIGLPISYVTSKDQLEEGYLYKYSKSLSGGGHLIYPKDELRIKKLLAQGETLIKEKELNRVMDFSTLVENGEVICTYENIIDAHFQYKGTLLGESFSLPEELHESYNHALDIIIDYTKPYRGVLSIDSYLYESREGVRLFPACELNIRKTMGYHALKIKEKYFSHTPWMMVSLIRNKLSITAKRELRKKLPSNIVLISDTNSMFLVFILLGETKQEVADLSEKLLPSFF